MSDSKPPADLQRVTGQDLERAIDVAAGTTERHRALATRWFQEVWNDRRAETVDEIFDAKGIGHLEGGDCDREGFKQAREALLNAFPDIQVTVEDTIAEGDRVAIRWSATATHSGDGLGPRATNRAVSFRGVTWMAFQNGLLAEGWDSWNLGALMESLK